MFLSCIYKPNFVHSPKWERQQFV